MKKKKLTITKALSIVAVASILLTAFFGLNTKELNKQVTPQEAIAIEQNLADFNNTEEKKKFFAKFSPWSLLSIPLWICSFLLSIFLKPLIGKIATVLFLALMLFLILLFTLKAMYPQKSFEEMLTKRNILCLLCSCIVFFTAFLLPDILKMHAPFLDYCFLFFGSICSFLMIRFSE